MAWQAVSAAGAHPSYDPDLPQDTVPFYDVSVYDRAVPNPNDFLVEPVGVWPAGWDEMDAYFRKLADASDRVLLEPHGLTHEGRELYHLIISAPENLARLDELRAAMDKVADPEAFGSAAELDAQVRDLPAFCWLAYSIHGDEISSCDAAVRLAWHLAAAGDEATLHLLKNLVILIEPSENPDGRERYLAMLETYRSATPNYDPWSLQHSGVWPRGRGNHYWFDLNRDWILLTQPETEGRVRSIVKYHPVLVIDGHEMGSDGTFLFSPPREPINPNTPANVLKWYEVYGREQAAALDRRGWPYYTGEWNDQWYVGYGSAWPTFFGAVGILYEQAGVDGRFVRQSGDYLLTYHEAVNHQFTSSLANLKTTADHRADILRDYHRSRKEITEAGRAGGLTFLFPPDRDEIKMSRFIRSLVAQGIQVTRATDSFADPSALNAYNEPRGRTAFPAGTFIVSTAQPHGALAKAILEFDPHLSKSFLEEERRELEKHGETRMYETSAWSVPLLYNLDAYFTTGRLPAAVEPITEAAPAGGGVHNADASYGYAVDMVGEKTYLVLNRLFAEDVTVHAAEKPFRLEGRDYGAGALVLRRRGNPDNLPDIVARLAAEVGIDIRGISTGYSEIGSKLGAGTFRLLRQPRVALAVGMPLSSGTSGSLWFTIDRQLGMPHSLVSFDRMAWSDLSSYNVLIIPDSWGGLGDLLGGGIPGKIAKWVGDGGTLILIGSSGDWAADTAGSLSAVRLRSQVLSRLGDYDAALQREIAADAPVVDTMALWHPEKVSAAKEEDKGEREGRATGSDEEADRWARRFHPRGVILQADLNPEHYLAFGLGRRLPVFVWADDCWLAKSPVTAVARLTPDEMKLRLAGLLWPEARRRWAGSAYITHERQGQGQIIMFAGDPTFRAYTYGTRQLLLNAVLYGPGFAGGFESYQQK